MNNTNVNKVERDQVECALILLEDVDQNAANLLRALIRAYCLFDVDLLEVREMLLRGAHRCKSVHSEFLELAMKVERVARDAPIVNKGEL